MNTHDEVVDIIAELVYEKLYPTKIFQNADVKTQDLFREILYEVYGIVEDDVMEQTVELDAEEFDDEDIFDDEEFE